MRRIAVALLAAFTCTLAACSTQAAQPAPVAAETPSVHPFSGLEVVPVTVGIGNKAHVVRAEVARTQQEWTQGLMFRREMGADEGMIFVSDTAETRSFWMRNTVIPLDIIFIGADHRILNIAADAVPYSLDSIPSVGPAIAVLELNGGRAAQLGIKPGMKVSW